MPVHVVDTRGCPSSWPARLDRLEPLGLPDATTGIEGKQRSAQAWSTADTDCGAPLRTASCWRNPLLTEDTRKHGPARSVGPHGQRTSSLGPRASRNRAREDAGHPRADRRCVSTSTLSTKAGGNVIACSLSKPLDGLAGVPVRAASKLSNAELLSSCESRVRNTSSRCPRSCLPYTSSCFDELEWDSSCPRSRIIIFGEVEDRCLDVGSDVVDLAVRCRPEDPRWQSPSPRPIRM